MGNGMKSGRSLVAGRLLWLVLALSSCLLPQNDDPLPDIPEQANRAPRIDLDTATPPRFFTFNVGANCKPPEVRAAVDDFDVSDRIRIRWVAYGEDGNPGPPFSDTSVQGGSAVRRIITAPMMVFTQGTLIATGRGRRLELIVADGEFSTDETGKKLIAIGADVGLPDGGVMENPAFLDTYTWVVDTISETCVQ